MTNSELGFDYLQDPLALLPAQTVLPGGVDEFGGFCVFWLSLLIRLTTSALIDEAWTPLIEQVPALANKFAMANTLVDPLLKDVHSTVDEKNQM